MFTAHFRRQRLIAAVLTLCCLAAFAPSARAQTGLEQAQSLAMVPEDAAAYGATLHNQDVFYAILDSKAYAKIAALEEEAYAFYGGVVGTAFLIVRGIAAVSPLVRIRRYRRAFDPDMKVVPAAGPGFSGMAVTGRF